VQRDIDIFGFTSPREYLARALHARERETLRGFSQRAGLKGPATLSLILNGRRSITPGVADRLATALKLSGRRKTYFFTLCRLTQKHENSGLLQDEILRQQSLARIEPLQAAQNRFLTHWYYVAIYVLVATPDFVENAELIARKLGNGITARQVENALLDLKALGMLRHENGTLSQAMGNFVKTSEEIKSLAIQSFHRQMLQLAARSLEKPVADREFSGLTVAISEEQLPAVKERIREFRESLDRFIEQGPQKKGRVYQFNVQLFPLTQK